MRAILGTLTVEEVYKDREQFAALVRDVAAPDVGRMGVEILSFTIKDLHDDVSYLESLGKSQTAAVKRDAEIGVAQVHIIKHAIEMCLRWSYYNLTQYEDVICHTIFDIIGRTGRRNTRGSMPERNDGRKI